MFNPPQCDSKRVIHVLKVLLIGYSFIFLVIGVVLFSFGLWGLLNLGAYFALAPQMTTHAVYVLIGTGICIFVVGIFGFIATMSGSRVMLNLYAAFLTIVYIAELVAGISGFTYRHEIKAKIQEAFNVALKSYNNSEPRSPIPTNANATTPAAAGTAAPAPPPASALSDNGKSIKYNMSSAVDAIQKRLKCCGVHNFSDWAQTAYFKENGIPSSCCKDKNSCPGADLRDLTKAKSKVHSKGCFALVTETVRKNMAIIAGSSFGLAFFQLVGLSMASFMSQYMKFNHYEIP